MPHQVFREEKEGKKKEPITETELPPISPYTKSPF